MKDYFMEQLQRLGVHQLSEQELWQLNDILEQQLEREWTFGGNRWWSEQAMPMFNELLAEDTLDNYIEVYILV